MKYCDTCQSTYPTGFTTCPKDQSLLKGVSDLLPGMILRDRYEVLEQIGAGGMAVVYKARHLAFKELRAIKVVSGRLADDDGFVQRFRTEAVVTRKLQHPNAVRVDDLDSTEDGRPFIVMEYVAGETLRSVIHRTGRFSIGRALLIARQVASALAAAHALGITHRDIKPDNILLVPGPGGADQVKVLDFGIAKVREGAFDVGEGYAPTQTGVVVGTPQYISPEQALGKRGDDVDGRADLYSLGVVLYEMIAGTLPFISDTSMGLILHHIQTPPLPPEILNPSLAVPPAVSKLLMKALEKDRDRRFRSAAEMVAALDAALPGIGESSDATGALLAETRGPQGTRVLPPTKAAPSGPVAPPSRARVPTAPNRVAVPDSPPRAPGRGPLFLVALGVLVLLAFLALRRPRGKEPESGDARIAADVQKALASDMLKQDALEAHVRRGVVTLTGRAGFQSDADIAVSLVQGIPGVSRVENQIRVGAPPTTPAREAPQGPGPGPGPAGPPLPPVGPPPPPGQGGPAPGGERHVFGALAYSELTGKTGTASNFPSREAAGTEATRSCEAPDCRVRAVFMDRCGAFAIGSNARMGTGLDRSREGAESHALETCAHHGGRGCRVIAWACNPHSP